MSRYQQMEVGVWDGQENAAVLPHTPAWREYQQWLNEGHAPDPLAPVDPQESIKRRRREHKRKAIMAYEENGTLGVQAASARFRLDADDRATLIGVLTSVNSGNALPTGFGWRSKDGTFTTLTQAQLKNLVEKAMQRDFDRRKKLWAILDAIEASANPDQQFINEAPNPDYVDVNAGWPT